MVLMSSNSDTTCSHAPFGWLDLETSGRQILDGRRGTPPIPIPDAFADGIRAVIVTPEGIHSEDLQLLLRSEPGMSIATACLCSDVASVIANYDPDLLVIDLRGQTLHGLWPDIRDHTHEQTSVLVVASNSNSVISAFDFGAVNFILEPLTSDHFHEAITKVRAQVQQNRYSRFGRQVMSLLQGTRIERPDHFVFKSNGRLVFLAWDDIDWIEAEANYVRINAGNDSYLMRESISRFSKHLNRQCFIRIHRSIIVNVNRIKELHPVNSGEYLALLKNGKQLSCSRGFRHCLDNFIGACRKK